MAACIGRFAPSPTGPLHFGSLVAALGSFADARAAGGTWRVRIDDIDPPREVPGAADDILYTLERHGLYWDGEVIYQSRRHDRYAEAIERLRAADAIYACTCTRRELRQSARRGPLGLVYPGTCRARGPIGQRAAALRLRMPATTLRLADTIQGDTRLDSAREIGDIILRRRDGCWAYHLANCVDDADIGITDIVRGADLLPSALVQVALQQVLGLPPIRRWAHLPIVPAADGSKLSKQTGARPMPVENPVNNLLAAWAFLEQALPSEHPAGVEDFLAHALRTWNPARIPRQAAQFSLPDCYLR